MVTTISVHPPSGDPYAVKRDGQVDDNGKPAVFPLRSPEPSETTSMSESGTSSDQEDFYLGSAARSRDAASSKQSRPNLNLVTAFPASQVEALSPGLKVGQVGARRTAAQNRPKSVVSAKAEHVNESGLVQRSKKVARIRDMVAKRANKADKVDKSSKVNRSGAHQRPDDTSPAKQIVIGISIPKHEAEAHDGKFGPESAISLMTPGTPHIVVTPAGQQTSSTREGDADVAHTMYVPPALPDRPTNKPANKTALARRDSFDSSDDDLSESIHSSAADDKAPRQSSESQRPILPDGRDDDRPKSQGWWTLPLSPMMSRAGTIKSIRKKTSPDDAHAHPLPDRSSKSIPPASELSPETPRRQGLASARASVWSRWTSWEKTKNHQVPAAGGPEIEPDDSISQKASANVGLAAEYYRACAIDQLSDEPYFECLHHSCAEKLPKLLSVFDREPDGNSDSTKDAAVAPVPMSMPDKDLQQQEEDDSETEDGRHSLSNTTNILSEPAEAMSPEVHEASFGTVAKAKAVESPPLRMGSLDKQEDEATLRALEGTDRYEATIPSRPAPLIPVAEAEAQSTHMGMTPELHSPGPMSPNAQRTMAPEGAVPMAEMPQEPQKLHVQDHHRYQPAAEPDLLRTERRRSDENPFKHADDDEDSQKHKHDEESQKGKRDKKVKVKVKAKVKEERGKADGKGLLAKLKECLGARKLGPSSSSSPKKTVLCWSIFSVLVLMIIGSVLLTTLLTRKGDDTPVQSQWLNLTGYPPIPTGISTIIRPDLTKSQTGCVVENMWSCALPKEDQAEVSPNAPNQPNFRFEITFENGTVPSNMTIPLSTRKRGLYTPDPSPPSLADQLFIGNTTDNITEPFNGEATPFFMTFISAYPIDPSDGDDNTTASTSASSRRRLMMRRDESNASNLTDAIPAPDVQSSNGSAAPANLVPTEPYPTSQPIHLYNRGLEDEHYGFYIYYDKAIFLSADAADPGSNATDAENTEDADGGSTRAEALARCTFSQTRFLVQIFTNADFSGQLLLGNGSTNTTANSALDYTQPGSFPYPTTITIDRHGGNVNKKAVYCYGLDAEQIVQDDVKAVVAELRAVGGPGLVNPAPSLFETANSTTGFDEDAGGIDGGVGGCECQWQNWT